LVRENGTRIDDPREMAEAMAAQFTNTSQKSSEQGTKKRRNRYRWTTETKKKNGRGFGGLLRVLTRSRPHSLRIHKKMARPGKIKILNAYEQIWRSSTFPTKWSEAFVIPILKPGKEPKRTDRLQTNFSDKLLLQAYGEDGEQ
jgi:hypothetical protein